MFGVEFWIIITNHITSFRMNHCWNISLTQYTIHFICVYLQKRTTSFNMYFCSLSSHSVMVLKYAYKIIQSEVIRTFIYNLKPGNFFICTFIHTIKMEWSILNCFCVFANPFGSQWHGQNGQWILNGQLKNCRLNRYSNHWGFEEDFIFSFELWMKFQNLEIHLKPPIVEHELLKCLYTMYFISLHESKWFLVEITRILVNVSISNMNCSHFEQSIVNSLLNSL